LANEGKVSRALLIVECAARKTGLLFSEETLPKSIDYKGEVEKRKINQRDEIWQK